MKFSAKKIRNFLSLPVTYFGDRGRGWCTSASTTDRVESNMGCVIVIVCYGGNPYLKPRIHEHAKWFANQMHVCVGLRTCAAPFTNSLHTIRREPKFVSFLREHKENWMTIHAPGVLCSPQVHRKLINRASLKRRKWTAQRLSGALMYNKLYISRSSTVFQDNLCTSVPLHTLETIYVLYAPNCNLLLISRKFLKKFWPLFEENVNLK